MRIVAIFGVWGWMAACGPDLDRCGRGVAEPGKVCYVPGPIIPAPDNATVSFADFDGDGVDDMVMQFSLDRAELHINEGDAQFGLLAEMVGFARVVRDFDGDGRVEILRPVDETKVELLELHGDGFVVQRELPWPEGYGYSQGRDFTFGDFDGDGVMDWVFCEPYLFAVFGEWDGDHADRVYLLPTEEEEEPPKPVYCFRGFFTADLNGDGRSELVVHRGANVEVFAGERLERRITIPSGYSRARSRYWRVHPIKLEDQGGMALVTWDREDVPPGEIPRVLRVRAFSVDPDDGSIPWSIEFHPEVEEVVIADVDGNGLDDLVFLDGRRSKVVLSHPGAPLGREGNAPFIRAAEPVWYLTAAHLNDDGIHDFVMDTLEDRQALLSNP